MNRLAEENLSGESGYSLNEMRQQIKSLQSFNCKGQKEKELKIIGLS